MDEVRPEEPATIPANDKDSAVAWIAIAWQGFCNQSFGSEMSDAEEPPTEEPNKKPSTAMRRRLIPSMHGGRRVPSTTGSRRVIPSIPGGRRVMPTMIGGNQGQDGYRQKNVCQMRNGSTITTRMRVTRMRVAKVPKAKLKAELKVRRTFG